MDEARDFHPFFYRNQGASTGLLAIHVRNGDFYPRRIERNRALPHHPGQKGVTGLTNVMDDQRLGGIDDRRPAHTLHILRPSFFACPAVSGDISYTGSVEKLESAGPPLRQAKYRS